MELEMMTQEWIDALPDDKYLVCERLNHRSDFIIKSENTEETLQFIEEVAKTLELKVIVVALKCREDVVGPPIIAMDDNTGLSYYNYDKPWWKKCVEENTETSVVIFNIDSATDRLVNMLKSYVENRNDNCFFGFIYSDKTRNIRTTTIYHLVKPVINWGEE